MRLWRGDPGGGDFTDYVVPAVEGEVVLDVIHRIQAGPAPDLACRWNCKAGKCGSCSAEINGLPRLMCMTRMDTLPQGAPVTVAPMKTFPIIRDLVTDVSFNYEVAKTVPAFAPGPEPEGGYRMAQIDVERGQEFRKCIECFMCQDVCHVIRDHEDNKPKYAGPRFFIRFAELEMHPLDVNDRRELASSTCRAESVQHHEVLHRGVPRAHQDHRQRHHSDERARGRRPLRPGGLARPQDPATHEEDGRRGVRRLSRRTTTRPTMPRYLSPEWVQAFNAALADLDLTDAVAAAGEVSLTVSGGTFRIAQIVTESPEGPPAEGAACTLLTVQGGRMTLEADPAGTPPADVTIVLAYDDAVAIARGALDPADALAAGRVRVRGELAVLVAGQAVLNAAGALLGTALTDLTDLDGADDMADREVAPAEDDRSDLQE